MALLGNTNNPLRALEGFWDQRFVLLYELDEVDPRSQHTSTND